MNARSASERSKPSNRAASAEARAARERIAAAAAECGVAELVVVAALVGVAQDLVGLGGLLELLFRFLVAGILVGVELEGLLAVRLLDLFARGVLVHAQHFVVVALASYVGE